MTLLGIAITLFAERQTLGPSLRLAGAYLVLEAIGATSKAAARMFERSTR